MDLAISKNEVPIRLTTERWQHITLGHPEIADYYYDILDTVENPELIYEGNDNSKIAIRKFQKRLDKFIVVVYKEINTTDGFVITAYFSSNQQEFKKKKILWKH